MLKELPICIVLKAIKFSILCWRLMSRQKAVPLNKIVECISVGTFDKPWPSSAWQSGSVWTVSHDLELYYLAPLCPACLPHWVIYLGGKYWHLGFWKLSELGVARTLCGSKYAMVLWASFCEVEVSFGTLCNITLGWTKTVALNLSFYRWLIYVSLVCVVYAPLCVCVCARTCTQLWSYGIWS